ncbi:MAG TPA: NB-ARC domain-containing protein [Thermoleophilaceae bacterium]
MTPVRGEPGLRAARAAAVHLCDGAGHPAGQGLALDVPGAGRVVLTCDHVVSQCGDGMKVFRGDVEEQPAARATHAETDVAAVWLADGEGDAPNPLLHDIEPDCFSGQVPVDVLTPGRQVKSFGATIHMATSLSVGAVNGNPARELPAAFRLSGAGSVEKGISGGVVLCEEGVVGLVHFARAGSRSEAAEAYANPISAWTRLVPELADLIEPFAEMRLRKRADVAWADRLRYDGALEIKNYRPDVYVAREEDTQVSRALHQGRAVVIVGRARSGKTRLACEVLRREHGHAIVVQPKQFLPPPNLQQAASLRGREVVLLIDNIHDQVPDLLVKPYEWWVELNSAGKKAAVIVTSRNAKDWRLAEPTVKPALRPIGVEPVCISEDEGPNLSMPDAYALGEQLGLSRDEVDERFDGTPGSLLGDPTDVAPKRSASLPDGRGAATTVESAPAGPDGSNDLPEVHGRLLAGADQVESVSALVERHRIVTLTGPRGTGKSRLAQAVARNVADRFPDAAKWVDISPHRDPVFVPHTVAAAFGLPDTDHRTPAERLVRHLRGARALIVLNGVDAVAGACAELAAELVARCEGVRILATGRRALGVPCEHEHATTGVSVGGGRDSEAVRLFEDRVRAGWPENPIGFEERDSIASICRHLGGNPLALELSASVAGEHGVARLADALGERGAAAGADPVELALDSATGALPEPERQLLARLAVFASDFDLAAAEAVGAEAAVAAATVPALVRSLVDRSFLVVDRRAGGGDRLRMHPAVRERALIDLEETGEGPRVRTRHARHYLELAEAAARAVGGPAGPSWRDEVARERQNMHAALAWLVRERKLEQRAFRMGAALSPFWYRRGLFAEGRRWLRRILARADEVEPTRSVAEAFAGAGGLAHNQSDYADAKRCYERSADLALGLEDQPEKVVQQLLARALNGLALVARRRCQFDEAERGFGDCARSARLYGLAHLEGIALNNLGNTLREQGRELERAETLQEESCTILARAGSEWGVAMALCDLGYVLLDRGELAAGEERLRQSLAIRERSDDPQGIGQSLNGLARAEQLQGRTENLAELRRGALRRFDEIGDLLRIAESLEGLASVELAGERHEATARLLGAADALRTAVGSPIPATERREVDVCAARAGAALGDDGYARAAAAGAAAPLEVIAAEL